MKRFCILSYCIFYGFKNIVVSDKCYFRKMRNKKKNKTEVASWDSLLYTLGNC